jgi:hypothetical protein
MSVVIFILGACANVAPDDKISQVAVPNFNVSLTFTMTPPKEIRSA